MEVYKCVVVGIENTIVKRKKGGINEKAQKKVKAQ